jgi:hypothetical protein
MTIRTETWMLLTTLTILRMFWILLTPVAMLRMFWMLLTMVMMIMTMVMKDVNNLMEAAVMRRLVFDSNF